MSVAKVWPNKPESAQGVAEIAEVAYTDAMQSDRPTNVVDRQGIAAGLKGDEAQQMLSIGMGGIDDQNLTIRCLGLREPTGLIVNETTLK